MQRWGKRPAPLQTSEAALQLHGGESLYDEDEAPAFLFPAVKQYLSSHTRATIAE